MLKTKVIHTQNSSGPNDLLHYITISALGIIYTYCICVVEILDTGVLLTVPVFPTPYVVISQW